MKTRRKLSTCYRVRRNLPKLFDRISRGATKTSPSQSRLANLTYDHLKTCRDCAMAFVAVRGEWVLS